MVLLCIQSNQFLPNRNWQGWQSVSENGEQYQCYSKSAKNYQGTSNTYTIASKTAHNNIIIPS